MIVLEIDIENVALIPMFETEGQSPIAAHRHGKAPGSISNESVEPSSTA
jgi:hypothetical protein